MCTQVPFCSHVAIGRPLLPRRLTIQLSGCMGAAKPVPQDMTDTSLLSVAQSVRPYRQSCEIQGGPRQLSAPKTAWNAAHMGRESMSFGQLKISNRLTVLCHLCSDEVQPSLRGPERACGGAKSKG